MNERAAMKCPRCNSVVLDIRMSNEVRYQCTCGVMYNARIALITGVQVVSYSLSFDKGLLYWVSSTERAHRNKCIWCPKQSLGIELPLLPYTATDEDIDKYLVLS